MGKIWFEFIKSMFAMVWFFLYGFLWLVGVFLFLYAIIKIFNL